MYFLYEFTSKMSESQIGGIIEIPVCREAGLLHVARFLSDKQSNLNIPLICSGSLGKCCELSSQTNTNIFFNYQ